MYLLSCLSWLRPVSISCNLLASQKNGEMGEQQQVAGESTELMEEKKEGGWARETGY